MNLIQQSFQQLFPDKNLAYRSVLKYNRKLGDFNASLRLQDNLLQINLNYKWKDIDPEIRIGLIQHLLLKLFTKRYRIKPKNTFNIELYSTFIKKIPLMAEKTQTHPLLESSFHRVNHQFFGSLLDQPNLKWGAVSRTKLAHYNFHNDTVAVSAVFRNSPGYVLDYLIYHELLHKKQQFYTKNNRSYFHTKKFRQAEDLFPDKSRIEKEIRRIIEDSKRKSRFFSLFSLFCKTPEK